MTSASPTFCLACQAGALCWRSSQRPKQGGAGGLTFSVSHYASSIQKCQHYCRAPRGKHASLHYTHGVVCFGVSI